MHGGTGGPRKLVLLGSAVVVAVEALALAGSSAPLLSVSSLGLILVLASAAGMFGLTLAAQRGRSPAPSWSFLMVLLAALGATVVFVAGAHRKVDLVQWLAVLATSGVAVVEAHRRRPVRTPASQ